MSQRLQPYVVEAATLFASGSHHERLDGAGEVMMLVPMNRYGEIIDYEVVIEVITSLMTTLVTEDAMNKVCNFISVS